MWQLVRGQMAIMYEDGYLFEWVVIRMNEMVTYLLNLLNNNAMTWQDLAADVYAYVAFHMWNNKFCQIAAYGKDWTKGFHFILI